MTIQQSILVGSIIIALGIIGAKIVAPYQYLASQTNLNGNLILSQDKFRFAPSNPRHWAAEATCAANDAPQRPRQPDLWPMLLLLVRMKLARWRLRLSNLVRLKA